MATSSCKFNPTLAIPASPMVLTSQNCFSMGRPGIYAHPWGHRNGLASFKLHVMGMRDGCFSKEIQDIIDRRREWKLGWQAQQTLLWSLGACFFPHVLTILTHFQSLPPSASLNQTYWILTASSGLKYWNYTHTYTPYIYFPIRLKVILKSFQTELAIVLFLIPILLPISFDLVYSTSVGPIVQSRNQP